MIKELHAAKKLAMEAIKQQISQLHQPTPAKNDQKNDSSWKENILLAGLGIGTLYLTHRLFNKSSSTSGLIDTWSSIIKPTI